MRLRPAYCLIVSSLALVAATPADLQTARDRQDRAALTTAVAERATTAQRQPNRADSHYQLAIARLYLAEVALQLKDKNASRAAAEEGIVAARRAIELEPKSAEYHRVLGTLCGQVIPANVLAGLKYGRCAMDEIAKAIELDPKSSDAWLSRGVGNFYLPPAFGGGIELAIRDFQKAIALQPKSADAHLWLGVALREANRNAEARQALTKALALNPDHVWARQQLEKTPR